MVTVARTRAALRKVLDTPLTEEQAREIYRQGESAVVFSLLTRRSGNGRGNAVILGRVDALSEGRMWASRRLTRVGSRRSARQSKAWSLVRGGRGGRHACGRALLSAAPMSAGGAEAWAAAGPAIDGCGTRRNSGPRRGSDAASRAVCPRNALQNEGRGMSRASEGPAAPDVPGGGLGAPSCPTTCRRRHRANVSSRKRGWGGCQSEPLSFMR